MADSPILISRREAIALGAAAALSPAFSMVSFAAAAPDGKVPKSLAGAMRWFQ